MKSIAYLFAFSFLFVATSCNSGKKETEQVPLAEPVVEKVVESQATPVPYQVLSGYFLKNTYKQESSADLIVAINKDQLVTAFGVAKTMTNKIDTVNFETQTVAAIALQTTDVKTDIKIDKVEKVDSIMGIHFSKVIGEKLTYKMSPVTLISFSKDPSIKQIELYNDRDKKTYKKL